VNSKESTQSAKKKQPFGGCMLLSIPHTHTHTYSHSRNSRYEHDNESVHAAFQSVVLNRWQSKVGKISTASYGWTTTFCLDNGRWDDGSLWLLLLCLSGRSPTHETVQRVGSRIAQASLDFAAHNHLATISRHPYTYTVVRSDTANAFVLPGNHVFVMTGLFKYVRDEDELAAVLGHEAAHNLARHAGEKVSGFYVVNLLARLSLIVDPSGVLFTVLMPAASLFRELPNSRTQETEADQIGIHLAAHACYDPRAAKRVFANMNAGAEGKSIGPEFLSTHPSHDKRLSNFDLWLPDAMREFESDFGGRCRDIRRDMGLARQEAARQAALRERDVNARES
jgi:hypothetical protein